MERSAVINMSGVKGPDFSTAIRLLQGSVISPLLLSLFTADWYENVKSERGKDWPELMENLREDFKEIMQWVRKWRVKLSIVKTEFCMFSLDNQVLEEARKYNFVIEGQTVKYKIQKQRSSE